MNGSREQEHQADALAPEAEEGRAKLRKATGRRLKAREPWISEWGNPAIVMDGHPQGREPGELKHLSTRRKRNQTRFP